MEEQIVTGAIVTEIKPHEDYSLGMSTEPFDWETGYIVPKFDQLEVKNQYQSLSCGGQAVAYYKALLEETVQQSARFVYSHVFAPDGGTAYEALGQFCKNVGSSDETLAPSYQNGKTTEAFMRTVDFTPEVYTKAGTKKSLRYAYMASDIESVAQAIRDNKGCIIGVFGSNNGTWRSENPQPPVGKGTWAHWLYAGQAGIYNGKKAIRVINSWGKSVGDKGYQWLTEEYFPNGIFMAWVLTDPDKVVVPVFKYTFTKRLTYGDPISPELTALQKALQQLGYMTKGQFGPFGPQTKQALAKFQKDNGIKDDGTNFGPITRAKLNLILNK